MCNCILSTHIEQTLFDKQFNSITNKDVVPDDICPICLIPLNEKTNGCCGIYSKNSKNVVIGFT